MVSPEARQSAMRAARCWRSRIFSAPVSGAGRREERDELVVRDGRGADLADDDAGGEVGEVGGGFDLEAGGHGGGEGGDDGVAGAGDVEDLAGAGGRVVARAGGEDLDAALAHGGGEVVEAVLGALALGGGEELVEMVGETPVAWESSLRLGQTMVAPEYLERSEVLGSTRMGMSQRRAARMVAGAELVGERALGVVGEDDGVDLFDEREDAVAEVFDVGAGGGFAGFDVEAEELLGAADDAGLGDGGKGGGDDAGGVDVRGFEGGGELALLGVGAPEAGEEGLAAEPGEVHGDVGGAAGALVAMGVAEDGDGGFGGDAVDVADDVAVEHEVADDEDADVVEAAFEEAEDAVEFGKHSRLRIARRAGGCPFSRAIAHQRVVGRGVRRILWGDWQT